MQLRSSAGRSTKEYGSVSGSGSVVVPCDDMVNAATFVDVDGRWKMEDGRWKMEDGRCSQITKAKLVDDNRICLSTQARWQRRWKLQNLGSWRH
jgi:hypothetical protein